MKEKNEGTVSSILVYMAILFVVVIGLYAISKEELQLKKELMEDAMVSACLGACTIDLNAYGRDSSTYINPESAYNEFCLLFRERLSLDINFRGSEDSVDFDFTNNKAITIKQFIVYNVDATGTTGSYRVYQNGVWSTEQSAAYPLLSPSGEEVRESSIFCKISFPVKTHFGVKGYSERSQLVGINTIR